MPFPMGQLRYRTFPRWLRIVVFLISIITTVAYFTFMLPR
jgi:hypothetical protein